MAIRITPNPKFTAKLPFTVAGEADPVLIPFEFRHKSPEALKVFFAEHRQSPTAEALSEVVVRWVDKVVDEEGVAVPFTPDNFRAFLEGHGPRAEDILRAYVRELTESRQKN